MGLPVKTIIYYFSGTGNSLATARLLCESLGACECISIAGLRDEKSEVTPDAERVGIVCPVYDFGLPSIVVDFAEMLDLQGVRYLFAVLTKGGLGDSALRQLDAVVGSQGRILDGAWTVRMPGNFVPLYGPPEGEKRAAILAKAEDEIASIAGQITREAVVRPGIAPITSILQKLLYGPFIENVHGSDMRFEVENTCTSCRICEEVCPVQNIRMVEGRPEWQHHCEFCLACLHFCPVQAIQWGLMTKRRGRYRHPDVSVADMERQQKGADLAGQET
ncbi:MAG: EFR1 family ferrodoxin [Methanomicrobiaceae archaeon]|nr:EFR1 family ferrodoxin [Methanomicrobiaceae archaeon]